MRLHFQPHARSELRIAESDGIKLKNKLVRILPRKTLTLLAPTCGFMKEIYEE